MSCPLSRGDGFMSSCPESTLKTSGLCPHDMYGVGFDETSKMRKKERSCLRLPREPVLSQREFKIESIFFLIQCPPKLLVSYWEAAKKLWGLFWGRGWSEIRIMSRNRAWNVFKNAGKWVMKELWHVTLGFTSPEMLMGDGLLTIHLTKQKRNLINTH